MGGGVGRVLSKYKLLANANDGQRRAESESEDSFTKYKDKHKYKQKDKHKYKQKDKHKNKQKDKYKYIKRKGQQRPVGFSVSQLLANTNDRQREVENKDTNTNTKYKYKYKIREGGVQQSA